MSVSEIENQSNSHPTSQPVSQSFSQWASHQSVRQYTTLTREAGSSYLVGRTQIDIQPLWLHTLLQPRHRHLPSRCSASNTHSAIIDVPSAQSGKIRSQCDAQLTANFLPLCPKTHNFCPQDLGFLFCTGNTDAVGSTKKLVNSVRQHGFIQEGTILQNHRACYWTVTFNIKKWYVV